MRAMQNTPPQKPPLFDPALLNVDDPAPFSLHNPQGKPRFILSSDHASRAVPHHMAGLGLAESELSRHIAWDIGAAEVTRHMAEHLDAPAFLAGYTRLIIDCNRPLTSPTSIPEISDGTVVPANQAVSNTEAKARADALYWPYHQQIASAIDRHIAGGEVPIFVAMHSFTPQMSTGEARPWHIGLLFEHDRRLVAPLKAALSATVLDICIGENEPYAIIGPSDYSIPEHGQRRGLPHIEIEVRQDLIDTSEGAALWARRIAEALEMVGKNLDETGKREIIPI